MVTRVCEAEPPGREIAHTADVGFEVEAPTLAGLFERAGLMLCHVTMDLCGVAPRQQIRIEVEAPALDDLLHDWLQALLVRTQLDGFVACELAVESVDATRVRAIVRGEEIADAGPRLRTEVKGVTYHQLAVRETGAGWWARVILDV